MHNFELILISDEGFSQSDIPLVEWALKNGIDRFHLRKKNTSQEAINKLLLGFDVSLLERITVHYHHQLLEAHESVIGIHHSLDYEKANPGLKAANSPAETSTRHSYSIHNWSELNEVEDRCDYVFISPVFESISKVGYSNEAILATSKQFLPNSNCKVIALGGIQPESIAILKEHSFNGAAILGAVWKCDSPKDKIKAFIKAKFH